MTSKNDVRILNQIMKGSKGNKLFAVSIKGIADKTELSIPKVRITVKSLLANGYIEEGFMQRSAKTYYITQKGKEILLNLMDGGNK